MKWNSEIRSKQFEIFLQLIVLPVDVFVVKQSSFISFLGKVSPRHTNF